MLDNQAPKKFRSNAIISMNDTVSGGDDSLCIGKSYVRIVLKHLINGFSHNLHVSFHGALSQCVIFEILEKFGLIFKERGDFFASSQNILKVFLCIIIHK